ncbi:hypothetical protein G7Y89_g10452 [Cudoniella acicularis]|uniref:Uncharacterized protein n=1 Tax=Cudoniella acicularis TaxID=354080 RepID=A0A8H4W0Y1_9HELO|nr:hypothetical protein G7Y89_g10452 [Cudoniella acicularis]
MTSSNPPSGPAALKQDLAGEDKDHKEFIHNIPPPNADSADVQKWIQSWFDERSVQFRSLPEIIKKTHWDGQDIYHNTQPQPQATFTMPPFLGSSQPEDAADEQPLRETILPTPGSQEGQGSLVSPSLSQIHPATPALSDSLDSSQNTTQPALQMPNTQPKLSPASAITSLTVEDLKKSIFDAIAKLEAKIEENNTKSSNMVIAALDTVIETLKTRNTEISNIATDIQELREHIKAEKDHMTPDYFSVEAGWKTIQFCHNVAIVINSGMLALLNSIAQAVVIHLLPAIFDVSEVDMRSRKCWE